ncbi:DUF2474 family protein [Roseovarius marisflavi]|nr:DUF2474 family protein [Roseovarius marisflavi]
MRGRERAKRLLWFAGLWLASVAALGVIAVLVRLAIPS